MPRTHNAKQLAAIREVMSDGNWRTLRDLEHALAYKYAQSSCSARLREHEAWAELGYVVERQCFLNVRANQRVYMYRLVTSPTRVETQHPLSVETGTTTARTPCDSVQMSFLIF